MAFSNSDIFRLTKYLINKSALSGYIRIDDFNLNLKISSTVLLKEKLGLSNDYQVNIPLSRKEKGKSTISDDEIRQFKSRQSISLSSGIGSLPTNYFKYDDIRVSGALEPVELLTSSELSRRLANAIDVPDALFPAAEIIGNSLYVYPTTITSATLTFYRYPITPILSYYIDLNGDIVPMEAGATHVLLEGETGSNGEGVGETVTSSTVEHEWGEDTAPDMAYIILRNMGIPLGRADVFQAADKIKKEGV